MTGKSSKGFTLIELLVVLSIISILFTITIPLYQSVSEKIQLDFLAKQIRTDLYWVQNQAIATGKQMNIHFPPGTDYYRIREGYIVKKVKYFDPKFFITNNYTDQTITFTNKGSVQGGTLYVKCKSGRYVTLTIQVISGRMSIDS